MTASSKFYFKVPTTALLLYSYLPCNICEHNVMRRLYSYHIQKQAIIDLYQARFRGMAANFRQIDIHYSLLDRNL